MGRARWVLAAGLLMAQRDTTESLRRLTEGRTAFERRQFAEAAEQARLALAADDRNADAWKLRGLALQLDGRLTEADQDLAAGLVRLPGDAELWFYLARVRYLLHALGPAEAAARGALRLRPEYADAFTQVGLIEEARQDHVAALRSYERAAELGRRQGRPDPMPLVSAGELLLRLGRHAESLEKLSAAAAAAPDSSRVRFARGRVLERLGRRGEAEAEYRRALALGGEPRVRAALARLAASTADPAAGDAGSQAAEGAIRFRERARAARVDFVLENSATPEKRQIETMPGGVAALDYDGDGWMDLFFVNGAEASTLRKTEPRFWNRLYRNNRDRTFTDVTPTAGVSGDGYGIGVAAGDFDNDGRPDLFVAGVHRNTLFHNNGNGKFTDVTVPAGLRPGASGTGKIWSVAGAWLDFDNDGDLDLFVVNYCKWDLGLDPFCGGTGPGQRTYCFPDRYEGLPNQLFRNDGGVFRDVSATSGIGAHVGKGMGAAVADVDGDGLSDILVANDTLPNFLFRNAGGARFEEVALEAGFGVPDSGRPVSGMGVDARDYDNDGRPDAVVTALEGETFPLFRNVGGGLFSDETYPSGLGLGTARRSGWGVGFVDLDNDGFKDLFTANAHVNDNIELFGEATYRQPNSVYRNLGNGSFRDVSLHAGADFQIRRAHRGSALADFDNDGRLDAVTTALNEPAELFINDSPGAGHWLLVRLVGTKSNRDGLGAGLTVTTGSGMRLYNHATTSVGYASSSDPRVHFGLGRDSRARTLEIRWPSGTVQVLRDVAADRILTIREP